MAKLETNVHHVVGAIELGKKLSLFKTGLIFL